MKPVTIESNASGAGHYAPGMVSRGMVYVSGQLPMDHEAGRMVLGSAAEQALQALNNVELVLKAAGAGRSDVVMCRVYIADVALWDEVNEAYAAFFGDHRPARVVVPAGELHHGALVEVEAVAELPEEA